MRGLGKDEGGKVEVVGGGGVGGGEGGGEGEHQLTIHNEQI
jgi:hypothetical protein